MGRKLEKEWGWLMAHERGALWRSGVQEAKPDEIHGEKMGKGVSGEVGSAGRCQRERIVGRMQVWRRGFGEASR